MYRRSTPGNEALERLTDERDHLKIQLHLATEQKRLDDATLKQLRDDLRDLERKIDAFWRSYSKS